MQILVIIVSLAVSVLAILLDLVLCFVWYLKPRTAKNKNDINVMYNTGRKMIFFSLLFFLSIWGLRYAVGYYSYFYPNDYVVAIHPLEQIGNSFLHALQTFSMDEDYTEYAVCGRDMIQSLTAGWRYCTQFVLAYRIFSAVLNVCAPVIGGAFIFEILAGIIPRIAFVFSKLAVWKETYYFSALNEQSLALAKNIRMTARRQKSTIVFTDAYIDDENEKSSEMLLAAKAIGAICLKDDITHISLNNISKKKIRIFLSANEENKNLSALAMLLNRWKEKQYKNMELFVFASDNEYSYLEDEVIYLSNRFYSQISDEQKDEQSKPRIIPVNGIKNTALNLFCDLPLFEAFNRKEADDGESTLNLTLFGIGAIGMETFLAANWFGQMLDTRLCINVVSRETEEEFEQKINLINPDILKSGKERDEILRFAEGEDKFSTPYFSLKYFSADVENTDLDALLSNKNDAGYSLLESDYIIVALGSDDDNFNLSDRLRQKIGYYHMNSAPDKKTIISYVIYNSELCRSLNNRNRHDNVLRAKDEYEFDVYMYAFGCMDDIYCIDNLFFERIDQAAFNMGIKYQMAADSHEYEKKKNKMYDNMEKDYYKYRANIARRLHLNYKAFSAGRLTPSLFFTASDKDFKDNISKGCEAYKCFVNSHEKSETDISLTHRLAWLEHRRWIAFMRVNGFCRPENIEKYYSLTSDVHSLHDHKFTMLKLHPCVVETEKEWKRISVDDMGNPADISDLSSSENYDFLDKISAQVAQLSGKDLSKAEDYKRWDYPVFEDFD